MLLQFCRSSYTRPGGKKPYEKVVLTIARLRIMDANSHVSCRSRQKYTSCIFTKSSKVPEMDAPTVSRSLQLCVRLPSPPSQPVAPRMLIRNYGRSEQASQPDGLNEATRRERLAGRGKLQSLKKRTHAVVVRESALRTSSSKLFQFKSKQKN